MDDRMGRALAARLASLAARAVSAVGASSEALGGNDLGCVMGLRVKNRYMRQRTWGPGSV